MSNVDISEIAQAAGFTVQGHSIYAESRSGPEHVNCTQALSRFANLIAQQERDRCLNILIDLAIHGGDGPQPEKHSSAAAKLFVFDATRLIRDVRAECSWRDSKRRKEASK